MSCNHSKDESRQTAKGFSESLKDHAGSVADGLNGFTDNSFRELSKIATKLDVVDALSIIQGDYSASNLSKVFGGFAGDAVGGFLGGAFVSASLVLFAFAIGASAIGYGVAVGAGTVLGGIADAEIGVGTAKQAFTDNDFSSVDDEVQRQREDYAKIILYDYN